MCSSGFSDFINSNFYVITKSWHAHHRENSPSGVVQPLLQCPCSLVFFASVAVRSPLASKLYLQLGVGIGWLGLVVSSLAAIPRGCPSMRLPTTTTLRASFWICVFQLFLSKGPPQRVDVKETSCRNTYEQI